MEKLGDSSFSNMAMVPGVEAREDRAALADENMIKLNTTYPTEV